MTGSQGNVGDTLENAPKWTGNASAEYRVDFSSETSGFTRMDINTTTHEHNNFDPTSIYYSLPGYSLANVRIGAKRNRIQSSLFVSNLFNKHTETALYESYAINLPTTRRIGLNRPRTIGIDLRYDW